MKNDFENIKKLYGENFAKFCRSSFSTILETEGLLSEIIQKRFAPSKFLYDDIHSRGLEDVFKAIVHYEYSLLSQDSEVEQTKFTPEELFKKAGYTLYKCETNDDVLSYKKYYRKDEEICTFRDADRIKRHHIFFAIKDNVDEIQREYFDIPQRQDEYGTSVISLQFDKVDHNLSIKNRYNHTVDNPDATFSNDLEQIYPGLKASFKKYYGIDVDKARSEPYLKGYVLAKDNKYYRCNTVSYETSYCAGNIVVDTNGKIIKYDNQRYELIDNFILDKKEKTLKHFSGDNIYKDSFLDFFQNIKKIEIVKLVNGKRKFTITTENDETAEIVVNKYNEIISYTNTHLTEIGNDFLACNKALRDINIPNVNKIGDNFLKENKDLRNFVMPNLKVIGDYCLHNAYILTNIDLPKLKTAGDCCLTNVRTSTNVNLPELQIVGYDFLKKCKYITNFEASKLERVGANFLNGNSSLQAINFPNLKYIGSGFLSDNTELVYIYLPEALAIGDGFCSQNVKLKSFVAPNLTNVGGGFLRANIDCSHFNAPNLQAIGYSFLANNKELTSIYLPNVTHIDHHFLSQNEKIEEVELNNVISIGDYFMASNKALKKVTLPRVAYIGGYFLEFNEELLELDLPNAEVIGLSFLENNEKLRILNIPNAQRIYNRFLYNNISLQEFNAPNLEIIERYFMSSNGALNVFNAPKLIEVGYDFLGNVRTLQLFNAPNLTEHEGMFLSKLSELEQLNCKIAILNKNFKEARKKYKATHKEEQLKFFKKLKLTIEGMLKKNDNEKIK